MTREAVHGFIQPSFNVAASKHQALNFQVPRNSQVLLTTTVSPALASLALTTNRDAKVALHLSINLTDFFARHEAWKWLDQSGEQA